MTMAGLGVNTNDEDKDSPLPVIGKSKRDLWKTLGTEWGRELVHPDLWVILAADYLRMRGPGMLVSDVRFENEASWVRKNGLLVHLERPEVASEDTHASEAGVERAPGDFIIVNDGSLDDLFMKVKGVFANVVKA